MSPPKAKTPTVLGVHPGMLDEVRYGTGPLWAAEGITRMVALARFGIPAVAFPGCWGWMSHGEPLKCWRYVHLRGRLVLVSFDADYRTNEHVHNAMQKL